MSDSPIVKTNGPKGDQGEAATIAVGTTTTLPPGSDATVTNVGDQNDAIFDFGIPRGDEGPGGTGYWEVGTNPDDIQNINSGSVIVKAGLFAGQCLFTNAAITGAQGTQGGDLVRYDTLTNGWVTIGTAQTITGAKIFRAPTVIGSGIAAADMDLTVTGGVTIGGGLNTQGIIASGIVVNGQLSADVITIDDPITEPNQAVTKAYVDAQAGGDSFWEASGNDIQNTNTGSVIIQNALFAGATLLTQATITDAQGTSPGNLVRYDTLQAYTPSNMVTTNTTQTISGQKTFSSANTLFTGSGSVQISGGLFAGATLATSVAQTAAQVTSGGNMVRWDYWNSNTLKTTDSTVVKTTGAQTLSSKTLSSCALSGTAQVSGLGTNTSQFVMCFNGNFMYRGPFISTALQTRNALLQIANLAGLDASMVETILTNNGMSLTAVTATPP